MLNNDSPPDPVTLYRAATDRAIAVVEAVKADQLGGDDASPQDRLLAAMGRQP